MSEKMLEIRDLTVNYVTDLETVYAVDGVSLTIEKGKTLGLVGETGAGKTTIAKSILQILPSRTARVVGGEVLIHGEDLLKKTPKELEKMRGRDMAMIFQDPMSALNPVETIGDQIYEALYYHNEEGKSKEELEKRVEELLEMVGILPRRKKDFPHQFSGGMKQRAIIAMALACQPKLLVADEPTTALDVTIQAQVLQLIKALREKNGTSMLLITHDLGIVALMCDDVAVMYAGEIVEYGSLEEIYSGDKHHPYTVGLFGAIPDITSKAPRLTPIAGLMPNPTVVYEGCKFAPRCPHATEKCRTSRPAYYENGHHKILCHRFTEGGENA